MWCRKRRLKYPSVAFGDSSPYRGAKGRTPFVRTVLSPLTGEMPRKGQRGSPQGLPIRPAGTPILFFRQYRIIRQGDLARIFSSQICCENAGILCVFQVFTADLWGKRTVKARRRNCAVLPLFFLLSSFFFCPHRGLTLPQNTTPLPPPSPPRPLSAAPFSAQTPSGCPQKCCRPM